MRTSTRTKYKHVGTNVGRYEHRYEGSDIDMQFRTQVCRYKHNCRYEHRYVGSNIGMQVQTFISRYEHRQVGMNRYVGTNVGEQVRTQLGRYEDDQLKRHQKCPNKCWNKGIVNTRLKCTILKVEWKCNHRSAAVTRTYVCTYYKMQIGMLTLCLFYFGDMSDVYMSDLHRQKAFLRKTKRCAKSIQLWQPWWWW